MVCPLKPRYIFVSKKKHIHKHSKTVQQTWKSKHAKDENNLVMPLLFAIRRQFYSYMINNVHIKTMLLLERSAQFFAELYS